MPTDPDPTPKSAMDMTPEEYRAARAQMRHDAAAQRLAARSAAAMARLERKWGKAAPTTAEN